MGRFLTALVILSITFQAESQIIISSTGSVTGDYISIGANGGTDGDILTLNNSGYLGINNTNPTVPLDVAGAVKFGNNALACIAGIEGSMRYNSTLKTMELCDGTSWTSINLSCDITPDGFNFNDVTNIALGSTQTTSIQQITGITCSITVSISGTGTPEYRTCSNATCSTVLTNWTSSNSTISNNQYLQLRVTSSANSLEVRTATVNVGGAVDNYSVTTLNAGTFKRVFLYQLNRPGGAYGGLAGADALCQADADAAGLGGTYLAWLATDSTDDPNTRFTKATVEYRNIGGTVIANNWTDLTDGGNLLNSIHDKADLSSAFSDFIWNNVNTDGTAASQTDNCNGWTSNGLGFSASVGDIDTAPSWTNSFTQTCDRANSLYCFEQ